MKKSRPSRTCLKEITERSLPSNIPQSVNATLDAIGPDYQPSNISPMTNGPLRPEAIGLMLAGIEIRLAALENITISEVGRELAKWQNRKRKMQRTLRAKRRRQYNSN